MNARTDGSRPNAFAERFNDKALNFADPDMWQSLNMDPTILIDPDAKAAMLLSNQRYARRRLLGVVKPVARLVLGAAAAVRSLMPEALAMPRTMHRVLASSLKRFAAPETNFLVLRHFHIGTEVLQFLRDNFPAFVAPVRDLRPRHVTDLADNMFVEHDLNLYRTIAGIGQQCGGDIGTLPAPERPDYSAITDGPFDIADMPDGPFNRIDLQTAVEAFTPSYQICLKDQDFWRASNSLQLDESVGRLVARVTGDPSFALGGFNRHPILPMPTIGAAWRLLLHGLSAEQLHFRLRKLKRRQAALA